MKLEETMEPSFTNIYILISHLSLFISQTHTLQFKYEVRFFVQCHNYAERTMWARIAYGKYRQFQMEEWNNSEKFLIIILLLWL